MRDNANRVPINILTDTLICDHKNGVLFWKPRTPEMFEDGLRTAQSICDGWNSRFAGKQAFTCEKNGYRCGRVKYTQLLAHVVIWAMHHNKWPSGDLDHINHNRSDNRINNLRIVNPAANLQNRTLPHNNTSGLIGVRNLDTGKWIATIGYSGKSIHLGTFTSKRDAAIARKSAEICLGYHKNHGSSNTHQPTDCGR